MRRRRSSVPGVDAPPVPNFVDDITLPPEERSHRFDEWMSEHYLPAVQWRDEIEERMGLVVDGLPPVPDGPFDLGSI